MTEPGLKGRRAGDRGVIYGAGGVSGREVAQHYDALDAFYREVWGDHVHHGLWERRGESREAAATRLARVAAAEAGVEAGSRVCDIGCGYGATAELLVRECGAEVTAITISAAQHRYACAQAPGSNPRFLHGDWLRNELPTGSFDAAIAIESLDHMEDRDGFFIQSRRVVREGGRLVICSWLAAEDPAPWEKRWLLEPICREGQIARLETVTTLVHLAADHGFLLLRKQDRTLQAAPTWPALARAFFAKLLLNPRRARFLFGRHARNRTFARTTARIWTAYKTGALQYGVFTFERERER